MWAASVVASAKPSLYQLLCMQHPSCPRRVSAADCILIFDLKMTAWVVGIVMVCAVPLPVDDLLFCYGIMSISVLFPLPLPLTLSVPLALTLPVSVPRITP